MEKICAHCGASFTAARAVRKYCSDSCRQLAFYQRSDREQEMTPVLAAGTAQGEKQEDGTVNALPLNVKAENYPQDIEEQAAVLLLNGQQEHPGQLQVKTEVIPQPILRPPVPYQYIQSRFIEAVAAQTEDSKEYAMFTIPGRYWDYSELEKVKWVSVRLRCLLENLLRLDRATVPVSLMEQVRDGLESIIAADQFQYLPVSYPYAGLVKELEVKCSTIIKANKKRKFIRLQFSRPVKIRVVAARFMLAALVSRQAFGELWVVTQESKEEHKAKKKAEARRKSRFRPSTRNSDTPGL
ncbi:MAG TPA: hypothetical protein PKA77_15470 [Chitinophagaceae bacterium]|jgi:hypothetical protein|nr:hypothetical protein [Chitinophagaceae bacterium]HMU59574.1 hypothetical protein [Chitinophagaceae bacterium]